MSLSCVNKVRRKRFKIKLNYVFATVLHCWLHAIQVGACASGFYWCFSWPLVQRQHCFSRVSIDRPTGLVNTDPADTHLFMLGLNISGGVGTFKKSGTGQGYMGKGRRNPWRISRCRVGKEWWEGNGRASPSPADEETSHSGGASVVSCPSRH